MTQGTRPPATVSLGFGIISKPKPSRQRSDDKPPSAPGLKPRVLVADADAGSRRLLENRLQGTHLITCVENASEALDSCIKSRPHLVITELRLEPMDGLTFLKELKSRWPEISVIILTAHGSIPDAVKATQAGAFGFLVKPIEKEELLGQVQRAVAASNFSPHAADWRANLDARAKLMEERISRANNAALVNSPVLLTGQNDTGKELLARAIHAASPRREKPFVSVNCDAPGEAKLELMLFGGNDRESGEAVTGAIQKAQYGTLYLDHVEQLPTRLQARLVHEVRDTDSLKGVGQVRADVRLICTTSGDLKAVMDRGQLRDDLYYFISVTPIETPPLGRRREDLPLLVSHFLEQATEDGQKKLYTPKTIEQLATKDWPKEVSHLFELVKKGVAINQDPVQIEPDAVPSYEEARDQFTRDYLVNHMQKTGGNITEAARLAKRNRTDFYKLLARFRLNAGDFKQPDLRKGDNNRRTADRANT
jgi:two-component system, NtrC family, response regulator GlrR